MSFKIEKNVAVPASVRTGGKSKYPWNEMDVGDSFFVPGAKVETFYTLTATQNKKDAGRRFIARKVDDGVRVWRIEVPAESPAEAPAADDAAAEAEEEKVVPAFVKRAAKGS
jgi:hypothetical protein